MQNRFGTKLVRIREIRTKERMRYVGMKRNILDTRSTAQTQSNAHLKLERCKSLEIL